MKRIQISALIIITGLFVLPLTAMSEVRVSLKNGRSMIADYCREAGARLVCDMEGGTVEFNRQDIESIRDVKLQRRDVTASPPDEAAAEERKKDEEKPVENARTEGKNSRTKTVGNLTAEQTRKYDELEKRRSELVADREKLITDREKLLQEVKDTGIIRSKEKLDAIQQKINALDHRIKDFNEQVNKLNEEISSLTSEGRNKQ
jgi:chromosome segregation ATPase